MIIGLIAPGFKPLPPQGWGAVESIVWDYYENLLKRNIDVHIINQSNPNNIVTECNSKKYDIIHIMYDDYICVTPYLNCKKILYTSHFAYITHPSFNINYAHYYNGIFKKVIEYQHLIHANVISEDIKQIYQKHGFSCSNNIKVICNGAREDLFKYSENPMFPNKSIYLAKIELRKRQYKYQNIPNIDFVGNLFNSTFNSTNPNYLGEWDKPKLYENMTEYANLILLSEGEADPLVVKEALIAGLGVVISECASANLDLSRDFITIIPNAKLDDIDYVTMEIEKNRRISIQKRSEIRKYALKHFAWNKIIDNYLELITKELMYK